MTVWVVFYNNGRFNFLDVAMTCEAAMKVASLPNGAIRATEYDLVWEAGATWDDGQTQQTLWAKASDGGDYCIAERVARE